MTTASPLRIAKRAARKRHPESRVAFVFLARACEASAPGEAPDAFRILAAGENQTDKGPLNFTPRSARLVMHAWQARGNPLALYYEHEDRLPLEQRGGAPMRGACSAPSANLAIRGTAAAPECWAEHVAWTEEAKRQIKTGERRQISPVAAYDEDSREVLEILNVSLCAEGATHNGTLLASRGGERSSIVDELMQALEEAIEGGNFEEAENIVQKMEEAAGGGDMAKMGRYAIKMAKAAKAAPPPPPPAPPPAASGRLAASREDVGAFDRAVAAAVAHAVAPERAAMVAATRESKRATVQTLIAANRTLFDVADEREHMRLADPEATQRHIASLTRKQVAGVIVLAKPTETVTEARPGAPPPKSKTAEEQLTQADKVFIEQYNRGQRDPKMHITAEDYLASRHKLGGPKAPPVGVA